MNDIKVRIQQSFNNASDTYDTYSFIQREVCKNLLKQLKNLSFRHDVIADFACGTGISTQEIMNAFSCRTLYAIDFSDKLLAKAKNKKLGSKVVFILADFDDIVFLKNCFQLLVCNMGFQWALDLKHTLTTSFLQLADFGVMAFSIPLQGTFHELKNDYRNYFLDSQSIVDLLEDTGFEISSFREENFVEAFNTPIETIRSIKNIGANCLIHSKREKGLLSIRRIKNTQLTYRIGFFIVKKSII
ncbi:methyltransferase domain-containing protein [Coxiella endosymbiont of Amblyomma nuttalli]|uniref:methyltransferase domain-containing protein n=1 Tax=Coxiella endosymbiont of Amblyomma nuttalli TaxID=2749996 RepID=UPI001BA94B75|nr:methyltransferase domain-containing protein [Coxiella endosymbiont of Amblyomma nuttalli]QTS83921.1 Malonyl-[acyl-carrier protein] O-methyltransferase [Coxiella endosymbiont of Amblyomma nuttalli]